MQLSPNPEAPFPTLSLTPYPCPSPLYSYPDHNPPLLVQVIFDDFDLNHVPDFPREVPKFLPRGLPTRWALSVVELEVPLPVADLSDDTLDDIAGRVEDMTSSGPSVEQARHE